MDASYTIKLEPDDGGWFASGMVGNLDHFSSGRTQEEAIESFNKSLVWTFEAHMKEYGNLNYIFPKGKP